MKVAINSQIDRFFDWVYTLPPSQQAAVARACRMLIVCAGAMAIGITAVASLALITLAQRALG